MKIRINGNSVRMRISKTELDKFTKTGLLEESTEFGNTVFNYALKSQPGLENLHSTYSDNTISIFVPEEFRFKWPETDTIGFDHNMDIGNGKTLFLLIEKDFACIDNALEDQSDNFVNPNAVC
jgi:hypothetical protein